MKTIGERVRQLRKERGFTRQGDLAKLVGVDQSVISDIENGAGFKAEVLIGLCKALDTTAEFLMLGQAAASKEEAAILAIFRKTNDEGRIAMLAMAQGVQKTYPRPAVVPTDHPQNMGELEKARVIHRSDPVRTDTFMSKGNKHLAFSIPGTSKKKGSASDQPSHPHSDAKPSKRREHSEGAATPRRAGKT